jgi:hypothetical protein
MARVDAVEGSSADAIERVDTQALAAVDEPGGIYEPLALLGLEDDEPERPSVEAAPVTGADEHGTPVIAAERAGSARRGDRRGLGRPLSPWPLGAG